MFASLPWTMKTYDETDFVQSMVWRECIRLHFNSISLTSRLWISNGNFAYIWMKMHHDRKLKHMTFIKFNRICRSMTKWTAWMGLNEILNSFGVLNHVHLCKQKRRKQKEEQRKKGKDLLKKRFHEKDMDWWWWWW